MSGLARDRGDGLVEGLRVLVVGMPNVGKSSLLNALRRVGVHKGVSRWNIEAYHRTSKQKLPISGDLLA